jgi:hypothetical protein
MISNWGPGEGIVTEKALPFSIITDFFRTEA